MRVIREKRLKTFVTLIGTEFNCLLTLHSRRIYDVSHPNPCIFT